MSTDFNRNVLYTAKHLIVSFYLVESPFRHICQQQITDLILVYKSDIDILLERQYPKGVHGYILKFFENLKHLSISGLPSLLTLGDLPLTTCSSSTLYKLCIDVNYFEDCLALLDGRLKQLTTFIVYISSTLSHSSVVYNMVSLYIIRFIFSGEKIHIGHSNSYFPYYYTLFHIELLYSFELIIMK
jgi:hypothetical protein